MPLSMGEQSGNGATAVTVWLCVLEAAFNNMKTHMSRFWGKSQLHTSRMEDGSSDLPFSRVLHSFPLPWLSLCPKRFSFLLTCWWSDTPSLFNGDMLTGAGSVQYVLLCSEIGRTWSQVEVLERIHLPDTHAGYYPVGHTYIFGVWHFHCTMHQHSRGCYYKVF